MVDDGYQSETGRWALLRGGEELKKKGACGGRQESVPVALRVSGLWVELTSDDDDGLMAGGGEKEILEGSLVVGRELRRGAMLVDLRYR
jgi:hypothetical protein